MGFLRPAEAVVARAIALAMTPPPPPDITAWCERNVVFDSRSPLPGPFDIRNYPFLREIHEVLSPEHPAREVTIRKSAQIGGTVSLLLPTIGVWHEYGPVDSLVVLPTLATAREFVLTKWLPMRRQAPSLRRLFGVGQGEQTDTLFNQETLRRDGSLKIVSAGSPDDLATTTRRLVLLDEVSKYEMTPKGDPEQLAISRASAFEDAKIVRNSTPQIDGVCRVTRAFERGDQRLFYVPCPHCGHEAPLTWENFRRSIDPERLYAAHFTCDACGCAIEHKDKERIIRAGRWVVQNPAGDHPSFHIWRAYSPTRDWASIAVEYARVMGWTGLRADSVDAERQMARAQAEQETEQTFWNDVLGLPFKMASKGPDWEVLRDRAENPPPGAPRPLPRGTLPAAGFILTAGVDCQEDRTEVQIVAFGPNFIRWVVEYIVIPHHIRSDECRAALDGLLKASFRTELGRKVALDALAIDAGAYTDDVWEWALKHPWHRVIATKGATSQNAPPLKRMEFDRKADRRAARRRRQGWIVGVSGLKGEFYARLDVADPAQRGYVRFAAGLGDEYYRQLTAEVRVLKRSTAGVMLSRWVIAEAGRRNEALDTMLLAEAAARFKDWHWLPEERWAAIAAERGTAPDEAQGDLFVDAPVVPKEAQPVGATALAPETDADVAPPVTWAPPMTKPPAPVSGGWLGGKVRRGWLKR
jgi:phage terminase large subunit GpA-like protein